MGEAKERRQRSDRSEVSERSARSDISYSESPRAHRSRGQRRHGDDRAGGRRKRTKPDKARKAKVSRRRERSRSSYDERSRSEKRPESEEEVHEGIMCNHCSMKPIVGDRFKCSVCPMYNLCETCYPKRAVVHPLEHKFYAQKVIV